MGVWHTLCCCYRSNLLVRYVVCDMVTLHMKLKIWSGMILALCAAAFRHGFLFSPKINFSLLWVLYLSIATVARYLGFESKSLSE